MIVDYLIVGTGISGLNMGLKLSKKYPQKTILLIDGSTTFGGRIQTVYNEKYSFESGAARFNNNHKNLLNYIKKYNLEGNVTKIPGNWEFVGNNKESNIKFSDVNELLLYLYEYYKDKTKWKDFLISKTVYEIVDHLFGKEQAQYMMNNHPYYSELSIMNSYDALKTFKRDLNETLQFYVLDCGLSKITENIYNECVDNNCIFKFSTKLVNISYIESTKKFMCASIENDKVFEIYSDNLILAIDGLSFQKLNLNTFNKYLTQKDVNFKDLQKSLNVQPLLRTYYKYRSSKNIWFKDMPKIVTDNKLRLRYIIPISYDNGTIMISYTDGKCAKYWYKKILEGTQDETLDKHLYKIFPDKKIPKPIRTFNYYWKEGASYWDKNIDSDKIIKILQKPTSLNLFICGDSYSHRQAWIEGALESSNNVFDIIAK
tara:strand:- start:3386 stop:4672 length:1287 start_codon:yes stop_codon:yes gene_type:complete